MTMNGRQFESLSGKLNDPDDGGFSANTSRGGGPPRNKYMVGQRDVEEGKHTMPSTGGAIKDYADSNASVLAKHDRYLGGWADGGLAYLDVPKGFPRTPQGEVAARKSTMENDQIAYGVMNTKGKYAGTKLNPHHPANQGEIQAQPSDAATWAEMPTHAAKYQSEPNIKLPKRNQSFS